jgi:glycine betaine/proline transport system substrate-binding protein
MVMQSFVAFGTLAAAITLTHGDYVVVDADCMRANQCSDKFGGGGICYEVKSTNFWDKCLASESPVARALMDPAVFIETNASTCESLGFRPLGGNLPSGDPFPCGTSVPDFCYGGCERSLVDVYVTDQDWFVREMLESGKFNPDADCPAWQARNPDCMKPETKEKHLVIGTPGVSFHRVANWVVVRALERLGYSVDVVDNMPHRDMYPIFVRGEIDLVTGSDLPFNHAPFLKDGAGDFMVVGTVNEATDIVVGVPSYTGLTQVSELVNADDFTPELLSLDTDTCPQCVMMGRSLADKLGFALREVTPEEFETEMAERMQQKEKFAVSWYLPSFLQVEVSGLTNLIGDVEPYARHNVGKTIIRKDSLHKLDDQSRAVLSAVFVGNDAISKMDVMVHKQNLTSSQAADAWISENQAIFDSYFSMLPEELLVQELLVV